MLHSFDTLYDYRMIMFEVKLQVCNQLKKRKDTENHDQLYSSNHLLKVVERDKLPYILIILAEK